MEYTVVLIKKYNDGTPLKKAMYTYASLTEAESVYHQHLTSIGASAIESIMCMVIAEDGTQHFCRYWKAVEAVEDVTE